MLRIAALAMLLGSPPVVLADTPPVQPLPPEVVADLPKLGSSHLSADGRWVASVLRLPNPQALPSGGSTVVRGMHKNVLRIMHTRSGETIAVDPQDREALNPSWSPDGSQLAFQAGIDDHAELWIWSAVSHKARRIRDLIPRTRAAPLRWTPDSRQLLLAILPEGATSESILRQTNTASSDADYPLDRRTPNARVAVYRSRAQNTEAERPDFARNNAYLGDLAVVDVASGNWRRLVTNFRPVDYRVSPDGEWASFTHSAGQQNASAYRNLYDVVVVALAGGPARVLMRDVPQATIVMSASWSPDARSLTFFDGGPGARHLSYAVDVRSGQVRTGSTQAMELREPSQPPVWMADSEYSYAIGGDAVWQTKLADLTTRRIPAPAGRRILRILTHGVDGTRAVSPDGRSLIIVTLDRDTKDEGFYALDLVTGTARAPYEQAVRLGRYNTDATPDGATVIYSAESADSRSQLWVTDGRFRSPRQLSNLNPELRAYRFGRSRLVRWRSADGEELRGAVLLPAGLQPGKKYPLVVNLYGGSRLSDELNVFGFDGGSTNFYDNMQLLATRGYAVLYADTLARVATPMRDIAASLLPGIDRLIDAGIADPDRVGLMGHSYGGYSVLAVLVQTGRFKAAIEMCGPANLTGVFRTMDADGTGWKISWAEESQGRMGGTLWEHRERYIENSPFFYLDRITTPLLIAHGAADRGVTVENSDEIFQALRRLGKDVEYAKYLGEGHTIVGRANAIDYANRMIAWFDEHLAPAPGGGK
jgi:dipeptidyl aminopeptidase/acylaminoacyl peptidase